MHRHRLILTFYAILWGAAAAFPQEPSPPVPPIAPVPPISPSWGDMDAVRAQAQALRFQIDADRIRDNVMAKMQGFAFAPQFPMKDRHDTGNRAYERGQRALD